MPDLVTVVRRLAVLTAAVAAIAAAFATSADAASFGEITHFGIGQFHPGESADGIGVDPTNNDVYVVDVVSEEEDKFRIQKFEPNSKGEYSAVASVAFKPKHVSGEEEVDEVEGVAIDPQLKRVYVLAAESRPQEDTLDPNDYAAEDLYAYSTKQSGSSLVEAEGVKEAVLAGSSVFSPLSKTLGVSLLEPTGLTLDPLTHEVIVLGEQETPEIPGEPGPEPRVALERVSDEGKEVGSRYVDINNVFEEEATSPLVSPTTGQVYLAGIDDEEDLLGEPSYGIVKIPTSFNSNEAPERFIEQPQQGLWTLPGADSSVLGDGAAIGPEGTIDIHASIHNQHEGGFVYPGVVSYSGAGALEGWVGGIPKIEQQETACAISLTARPAALIAAGSEHKIFVYDDKRLTEGRNEARIVEFGEGGGHCLGASATVPAASVLGQPVTEPVRITETVAFASKLSQANAVSVKWEFGDGTEQTVSALEYGQTAVTHKFATPGEHTVKEIIHTDDRATPVIEGQTTIDILAVPAPKVEKPEAGAITATTASITATVNPNEAEITSCVVEYGTTLPFTSSAPCAPAKGFIEVKKVIASLSGLSERTLYRYRVVAVSAAGSGSAEGTLTTSTQAPKPPTAETRPATSVGPSSAILNAGVAPNGASVTACEFQYGTTSSYGASVPCGASVPGVGTSLVAISAPVGSLGPATTYHDRIVAVTANGTTYGSDSTFTTEATAPGPGPGTGNTGTGTTSTTPQSGVLPSSETKPAPIVTLSGGASAVSGSGSFTVKIACPKEAVSCSGTVTLRTAKAVLASVGHAAKRKAAILTLATVSFTVAGGQTKTLTLHLVSKARTLLAHSHVVIGRATIIASDPAGVTHTTLATVTLRAAKAKHHG